MPRRPIGRVTLASGSYRAERLSVAELMDENTDHEDSAWFWCEELLASGHYDDSDYRGGVVVHYFAADSDELRRQMDDWRRSHPGVLEDDLFGGAAR